MRPALIDVGPRQAVEMHDWTSIERWPNSLPMTTRAPNDTVANHAVQENQAEWSSSLPWWGPAAPWPISNTISPRNLDLPVRAAAEEIATVQCSNVEGPEAAWTTSYKDAAWWILACEETPFPVSEAPPKRREVKPSPTAAETVTSTIEVSPVPTVSHADIARQPNEAAASFGPGLLGAFVAIIAIVVATL